MKNLLKLLVGTAVFWCTAEYYSHKGKVVALETASMFEKSEDANVDAMIDHLRDEEYLDGMSYDKSTKRRLLRIGHDVKKVSERGY